MANPKNKVLAKAFLPVLTSLGVHHLFRFINKQKILILLYHGVTLEPLVPPCSTQLDAQHFTKQMEYIKRHYHVMPLHEVIRKIKQQELLPDHSCVITFDDGFENNYSTVFSILKRLQIPVTIFLSTGLMDTSKILWPQELYLLMTASREKELDMRDYGMGRYDLSDMSTNTNIMTINTQVIDDLRRDMKRFLDAEKAKLLKVIKERLAVKDIDAKLVKLFSFLSWDQIKEMHQSGLISFGSHTVNHPLLSNLNSQEISEEIEGSFKSLRQHLGLEEILFAYTFGEVEDYTEVTKDILKKHGASCALTTTDGLNDPSDNLFELKRVFTNINENAFKLATSGFIMAIKAWKK